MDSQVTGDPYFEARLELFKFIVQEYREAFKRSTVPSRDQGFFLCGQMCNFLHRLLRRVVSRDCLPSEWDWDALRSFDFSVDELLGIPEFMRKTEFRSKLLKVAKSKIDVERERGKKARSDSVAKTVMGESFNPFIDQGRQYVKYVAKELVKHPTFKSDLVIGLASFDYGVLFKLPKTVAVDCFQHLFHSFGSRGWVARELRNVHIDDYLEFVDDMRHVYLDELGVGPDVEDMVSFLSSCPELSRRQYTWDLLKSSCLCLGHVVPELPGVSLGTSKVGVTSVDLSSVVEPLQGYLLSSDAEGNFFTDPESISCCKTHHHGVADLLAGKLRSKCKTSNNESS